MLWVPEANRFSTEGNDSLGQDIFNMSVAKAKSVVELNNVGDEI